MQLGIRIRAVALVTAGLFVAVACGGSSTTTQTAAKDQFLTINIGVEPVSLDPGQTQYDYEASVVRQNFEALVIAKNDLSGVRPGAAASWETSTDGLKWTFHLQPNGKWSDGTPVTAGDFVYAWQRILDPRLAAPYADPFFDGAIKGSEHYGDLDPKKNTPAEFTAYINGLGLSAKDDKTFVVTLQQPTPYFQWLASLWMAAPVKQSVVSKAPDTWSTKVETLISNGPFKISEIAAKDHITLVTNPNWWGWASKPAGQQHLTKITMLEISDEVAAFQKYQNGELDLGGVPLSQTDSVRADPVLSKQLSSSPVLVSFWIQYNTKKAPFDNAKVRLAFSKAIDRESFVTNVLKNRGIASAAFIPKGMNGYDLSTGVAQKYDPAAAKALLDSSGAKASDLNNLHFLVRTSPSNLLIAQFVVAQLKTNLGLTVVIDSIESKTVSKRLSKNDFTFEGVGGWGADYADPQDWFDIFKCGSGNQFDQYCNPAYDKLVAAGDVEIDATKRASDYKQAQAILVQDAPVAFLYQRITFGLLKPYVAGVTRTALDDWAGDLNTNLIFVTQH